MSECTVPPIGWRCTRDAGHDGPCAAEPTVVWTDHPWYPRTLRYRLRSRLPRRYLIWSYMRSLRKAMAEVAASESFDSHRRPKMPDLALPNVQAGQVWADNDKRAQGRLVLVLRAPTSDEIQSVPNPGYLKAMVEVVRSRDGAGGREDSLTRGRRRSIRLSRFRPTSTGYRLTDLTAEDVS